MTARLADCVQSIAEFDTFQVTSLAITKVHCPSDEITLNVI
jgi:hypothetical protein